MKYKILFGILLMILVTNTANASSMHGEYEGNRIVEVKYEGRNLQIEDVPAINYHNRTMVPIYLLKQLGFNTTWDQKSYSVNLSLATQKESIDQEEFMDEIENEVLVLLSDVNLLQFTYVEKLNSYIQLNDLSNYTAQIELNHKNMIQRFNKFMVGILEINNKLKSKDIDKIIKDQGKVIDAITQSKNTLIFYANSPGTNVHLENFNTNILNCLEAIQSNTEEVMEKRLDRLLYNINYEYLETSKSSHASIE